MNVLSKTGSSANTPRYVADQDDEQWNIDLHDAEQRGTEPPEADEVHTVPDDAIRLYLRTIGQVPLLTAPEEVELAQQIERGKQARSRLEADVPLSWEERTTLEWAVAQANEARQSLIQANLRLVVSVAKKYRHSPMSLMDLIQEGNIGLMRAVEKFDYRRGYRFSTYATWWIRQGITRAIAQQGRLIRLPVHMSEAMGQLRRTVEKLHQASEQDPQPEDIAQVMQVSVRKVRQLLHAPAQSVSIEQPLRGEGEGRLGDLIADDTSCTPFDVAIQDMLHHDLASALDKLPERHRQILQLRYGLTDGTRRTLEEVGTAFGITRERARQIEAEAIQRMRQPDIGKHLRGYLEHSV